MEKYVVENHFNNKDFMAMFISFLYEYDYDSFDKIKLKEYIMNCKKENLFVKLLSVFKVFDNDIYDYDYLVSYFVTKGLLSEDKQDKNILITERKVLLEIAVENKIFYIQEMLDFVDEFSSKYLQSDDNDFLNRR